MKKKIKFELLLASDQSLQDKCREEMLKKFGARVQPLSESEKVDNSGAGGFFEITLKVEENKIWDTARALSEIGGVLDVDPIVPIKLEKILADLEYQGEQEEKKKQKERQRPEAAWFHRQTRFREAIQYAIAEYKAGRGCYAGGETNIKIAQLDTGYSNHPEIVKIKKETGVNYVPPLLWIRRLKRSWWRDPKDRLLSLTPFKWGSHGTSSASVIIGTDTGNIHVAKGYEDRTDGIFPYVDVIPYRISDAVISFHNNMARAAKRAILDGCKIITASHAQLLKSGQLQARVAEAYERGIIWVAAAGSHIAKVKRIWIYPAKFPEIIATAASTCENEPWEKTHAGTKVEICAPGYDIYRPFARRRWWGVLGPPFYGYGWGEGSTFAAPITAAAAALWLAHHGEEKLNQLYTEPWQRVEAFRKVLRESAQPHRDSKYFGLYGAGILDVEKLLKTPLPNPRDLTHVTKKRALPDETSASQRIAYIVGKEIIHWTCCAKVETEDQKDDELYHYVHEKCSGKAREVLESIIATQDKPLAKIAGPGTAANAKSEALKRYVKDFAEEWD
jgi:hypothetical protein